MAHRTARNRTSFKPLWASLAVLEHTWLLERRTRWLKAALELPGAERRTAARAKALYAAGELGGFQENEREASLLLRQSVTLYRELGDDRGLIGPLVQLGVLMQRQARTAEACSIVEESIALCRMYNSAWDLSRLLLGLGYNAWLTGNLAQAITMTQESLSLLRLLDNKSHLATALNNLGYCVWCQGDLTQAEALTQEGISLVRELGLKSLLPPAIAWSFRHLSSCTLLTSS